MQLISTKICKTSDIGINNNLFGGTMLSWRIDQNGEPVEIDPEIRKNYNHLS